VDRAAHVQPEKFWQGLATAMEKPDIFQDRALPAGRAASTTRKT
jgi:hypothetical protein